MSYQSGWSPNQSGHGSAPYRPENGFGQRRDQPRDPRQPFGTQNPPQGMPHLSADQQAEYRDPRQSFDRTPPPNLSVADFAPRRNVTFILAFLSALILIGGLFLIPKALQPSSTPSPTKSSTPVSAPAPAVSPGVNGLPWETPSGKGFWQIDETRFDAESIQMKMTLRVDEGTISYSWFVFDNSTSELHDAIDSGYDGLRPGTLDAGKSVSGWVRFKTSRGPTTVILSDSSVRQVTALLVKP